MDFIIHFALYNLFWILLFSIIAMLVRGFYRDYRKGDLTINFKK